MVCGKVLSLSPQLALYIMLTRCDCDHENCPECNPGPNEPPPVTGEGVRVFVANVRDLSRGDLKAWTLNEFFGFDTIAKYHDFLEKVKHAVRNNTLTLLSNESEVLEKADGDVPWRANTLVRLLIDDAYRPTNNRGTTRLIDISASAARRMEEFEDVINEILDNDGDDFECVCAIRSYFMLFACEGNVIG